MAIKNPKSKGNGFEREVYKLFRDMGLPVKRTLGSGSTDEPGDILVTINNILYSFDTKFYSKLFWRDLEKMFFKLSSECATKKVNDANAVPVLLIRLNGQKEWEIIEGEGNVIKRVRFKDWLREHGL